MFNRMHRPNIVERLRAAIGGGLDVGDMEVSTVVGLRPEPILLDMLTLEPPIVRIPDLLEFGTLRRGGVSRQIVWVVALVLWLESRQEAVRLGADGTVAAAPIRDPQDISVRLRRDLGDCGFLVLLWSRCGRAEERLVAPPVGGLPLRPDLMGGSQVPAPQRFTLQACGIDRSLGHAFSP
jgi:hypothetical protein